MQSQALISQIQVCATLNSRTKRWISIWIRIVSMRIRWRTVHQSTHLEYSKTAPNKTTGRVDSLEHRVKMQALPTAISRIHNRVYCRIQSTRIARQQLDKQLPMANKHNSLWVKVLMLSHWFRPPRGTVTICLKNNQSSLVSRPGMTTKTPSQKRSTSILKTQIK